MAYGLVGQRISQSLTAPSADPETYTLSLICLNDESSTISDHLGLRHFVVFDPDVALDIVVDFDVEIEHELLTQ